MCFGYRLVSPNWRVFVYISWGMVMAVVWKGRVCVGYATGGVLYPAAERSSNEMEDGKSLKKVRTDHK